MARVPERASQVIEDAPGSCESAPIGNEATTPIEQKKRRVIRRFLRRLLSLSDYLPGTPPRGRHRCRSALAGQRNDIGSRNG
jgi:hypothetical protein